ncbi:hypothetical protein [Psychromonas arctica]|uniref:hypothetical protein n=1 Tax=Psychromonas arctica TaxID=168275 RepID=UPI002FD6B972
MKLGDDIDFKLNNNEINELTTQGYKIVASIEASYVGEARNEFELNKNNATHKDKENEFSNLIEYFKFTSNLFLFVIVGAFILIITGFSLSVFYSTEELSFYFLK